METYDRFLLPRLQPEISGHPTVVLVRSSIALPPVVELHAPGADHRSHLQAALAGRAVLQMDQAAPADQGLLRHQRKRGEDSDLDRGVDVRAGGDRAQAAGAGGQPVPDSTDSQPHAFRENAHFMRPSGHRPGRQYRRKCQPTDSLRLLTGQQWYQIFDLWAATVFRLKRRETTPAV